jgi:multiple sugar transport system substrate-binding protein
MIDRFTRALLVAFVAAGSLAFAQQSQYAGTTLYFVVQPDVFAEPVRRLIPRFTQETGIIVNMETMPYASLRERQLTDFVGGTGSIDVMTMDIVWMGEYAEAGWIENLGPYYARDAELIDPDDFLPGAMQGLALWDGEYFGMPLGAYYFIMHSRSDVLAAAGVEVPTTLDELVAAVKAVHDPANEMYGFSAGYRRGAPVVHDSLSYYTSLGGGVLADFPNDLSPNMNTELGLRVYGFYKEMLDYAPPGAINFDFRERREPFQQGRVAMVGNWSSSSAAFEDPRNSVEAVIGNVVHSYLPRASADSDPVVPFGGWALVMNADGKNKEAVWEFMRWLSSPEIQKVYAADGGTPFRFSTLRDPALAATRPWYQLILDAEANGWVRAEYRPRFPVWPQLEEQLGLYLSEAMSGGRPIPEALARVDAEMLRILRENGYSVP